jgi:hypothetical protein
MRSGGPMTNAPQPLTPTDLIAASSSVLEGGGFRPVREGFAEWSTSSTRLFEDEYSVVGVAVFATCAELLHSWADMQGSLVDLISRKVGQTENKAWDGYLALLTPGQAPSGELDIEAVRYDTTRLRKLVATGEDLISAGDVERLLRPLLPLRGGQGSISSRSALDLLPEILAERGINQEITNALLQSFADRKPLMEPLYRSLDTK